MKKSMQQSRLTSHDEMEISHLAFDLWQQAGRPPCRYIQYWEKAKQRIITARHALPGKAKAAVTVPEASLPRQSRSAAHR